MEIPGSFYRNLHTAPIIFPAGSRLGEPIRDIGSEHLPKLSQLNHDESFAASKSSTKSSSDMTLLVLFLVLRKSSHRSR